MEITSIQRPAAGADVAPEQLAGNSHLTQQQKIAEASRQFEAVLLRQILGDAQKTVLPSEFSDDSTASGIYHDMVTNTLADSMSKSGGFGLAKVFEQQLSPASKAPKAGEGSSATKPATAAIPAQPESKKITANPFLHLHRNAMFPALTS
jgi:Rod binding domain-containing protein